MYSLKRTPQWMATAVATVGTLWCSPLNAQTPLAWDATPYFRYSVEDVMLDLDPVSGKRRATVLFSVTNPVEGESWNIKTDVPFIQGPTYSRLAVVIGWNTRDYSNVGSRGDGVNTVPFGGGAGAALPISIDALRNAIPVGDKYLVTALLPDAAQGTGVAALEGRLAWPIEVDGALAYAQVPVKSAYRYFPITDATALARREVVAIEKCQVCHDGSVHGDQVIPRLSLHGANRTEELHVCVICHNPSQTDIPYRTFGSEVPVDFKVMVHAIHGNKRRQTPYVVIGRNGSTNDYGHVEYPGNPRDCLKCHNEANGRGTFELPLASNVRGTTINSRSVPGSVVDVNPANDLRITPTAAVCSSCHDSSKARTHMTSSQSGGAFGVTQADIDSRRVVERCANCHGPGRAKSVRKVHS